MNLTEETKRRLIEMEIFKAKVNAVLGIRPKMEVIYTGGKPQGTFDLRSLNKALLQKSY